MRLSTLIEMPLKAIEIDDNREHLSGFDEIDIKSAQKQINSGNYAVKLEKLPFDFYVYLGRDKKRAKLLADKAHKENSQAVFTSITWSPRSVSAEFKTSSKSVDVTLTPWILVHRFFQESLGLSANPGVVFKRFTKNLLAISKDHLKIKPTGNYFLEIYRSVFEFHSARTNILDANEYVNELAVDIAFTGRLRYNLSRLKETLKNVYDIDESEIEKLALSAEDDLHEFKKNADRLFNAIKGKSFDGDDFGHYLVNGLDYFKGAGS